MMNAFLLFILLFPSLQLLFHTLFYYHLEQQPCVFLHQTPPVRVHIIPTSSEQIA
jgi:hypothetical protein